MPDRKDPWTAELIEQVSARWSNGVSASVIAAEFKLTRNSVMGKMRRLNVATSASVGPRPVYVKQPRVERKTPFRSPRKASSDSSQPALLSSQTWALPPVECFMLLQRGQCHYPMDGRYCGGVAKSESSSYCDSHHKLTHV